MRNKPKEPPKVPKAAPFFLPTIPGLQPKFAAPGDTVETGKVSTNVLECFGGNMLVGKFCIIDDITCIL